MTIQKIQSFVTGVEMSDRPGSKSHVGLILHLTEEQSRQLKEMHARGPVFVRAIPRAR